MIDCKNATVCHICNKGFNVLPLIEVDEFCDDGEELLSIKLQNENIKKENDNNMKVLDHDHYNGKYRGAAHKVCNLQYKLTKDIPVIFHNFKGYDCHLLVSEVVEYFDHDDNKVEVIAESKEMF